MLILFMSNEKIKLRYDKIISDKMRWDKIIWDKMRLDEMR